MIQWKYENTKQKKTKAKKQKQNKKKERESRKKSQYTNYLHWVFQSSYKTEY